MTKTDMYGRVSWMVGADEAIVRALADSGFELQTGNIARNIGFTSDYVGKRLAVLEDKGLVDADRDDGFAWYYATDLGQQLADGELSADDLESL